MEIKDIILKNLKNHIMQHDKHLVSDEINDKNCCSWILQSFADLVREKTVKEVDKIDKYIGEKKLDGLERAYNEGQRDGIIWLESNFLSSLGMEEKV